MFVCIFHIYFKHTGLVGVSMEEMGYGGASCLDPTQPWHKKVLLEHSVLAPGADCVLGIRRKTLPVDGALQGRD